ncbi:MAG: UvrD-helicase domain-containing protein [Pirellulales bacterium]|nr:UvrD-helicase domain-containing protein [Pirellulales bacterium]
MTAATRFTDEQARAIAERKHSVALSAGAGCGKTFVLTERFLSHLDPHGPAQRRVKHLSQLVAITFTERAAREMRDRIREACRRRLLGADDADAGHWLSLLRDLDSARIGTIHGFCGSLLRSHAVEAGLDPRFSVIETAEAHTILSEAMDDQLRRLLTARDESALELVARLGLPRVREYLAQLVESRQDIDFGRWIQETPAALVTLWQQYQQATALPALLRRLATSRGTIELTELLREHVPDHPVMQQRRLILLDLLPQLQSDPLPSNPAQLLRDIREQAKVQGGGSAKVWPSEDVYERVKNRLTSLRAEIDQVGKHVELDLGGCLVSADLGLRLIHVAAEVATAYERRKREAAQLDFNDLLIGARALLTDPAHEHVRRNAASAIQMLLVDEFQDTDPLQVSLIKALCGNELARGKLFFVGDHKQSIYRFRGADPSVFRRLREETPEQGRLPLSRNFRSQPAILDFVNALFFDSLGDHYEPLAAHRPQLTEKPAIEFLWSPKQEDDLSKSQQRQREADWIARRLRTLIDERTPLVVDHGKQPGEAPHLRPVRQGDVAILFRALSDVEYYETALQRYGLDYYLVGGHAFYAQQEIHDLLNLLRAVASPCDEVSLVGVLRSPFFSLTDEALYWLARQNGGLAVGLFTQKLPRQLAPAEQERAAFAAATLRELRARKDRLPVAALVNEALARTGYDAILLAEFLGERKLANLKKLVEQARQFDRTGTFTLDDFIAQLSEFVARQPHEPPAATQSEDTDVVRLMTIHQSKGLEFPVVVVPDLDRKSLARGSGMAFDPQLGPLVRVPQEREDKQPTTGYELLALVEQAEEEAETRRLFYVATTRAADYLMLASSVESLGEPGGAWTQLLARRFDLATGELCGVLPPGMERPLVRVTSTEPPLPAGGTTSKPRVDLAETLAGLERAGRQTTGQLPRLVAPVPVRLLAPRQFSVSRLSGDLHSTQIVADEERGELLDLETIEPDLRSGGAALGTLVHAVMAETPWAGQVDLPRLVREQAENLNLVASVDLQQAAELVAHFCKSPRAAELSHAQAVYTELEFMLACPDDTNGIPPGCYLRGYIDCLYQDARGTWHLLDYKTNDTKSATLDDLAQHYELQMAVYTLAAEQSLGSELASSTLHFLRAGEERACLVGSKNRRRAEQLLRERLAHVASVA